MLIPLIYGYWRTIYAIENYGTTASETWGRPWYVASAVATIPLCIYFIRRIRLSKNLLAIHKNGLFIQRRKKPHLTIFWDGITGFKYSGSAIRFLGNSILAGNYVTLYLKNKNPIILSNNFPSLPEIASRIKVRIYPRIEREIRKSIASGRTIEFGKIHLHKQYMIISKRRYSWKNIADIKINSGNLVITTTDRSTIKINGKNLVNLDILLHIILEGVEQ